MYPIPVVDIFLPAVPGNSFLFAKTRYEMVYCELS